MRRALSCALVGSALLVAACGAAPQPRASEPAVRDSAGIVIVENDAAMAESGWHVSAEPLLQIGVAQGNAPYEFDDIEAVWRLADGRIVVADGGSRQIRFFDAAGVFLSASGRRGAGPGEYRSVSQLVVTAGDTLHVFDDGLKRISVLDGVGRLVRTVRVGPPEGFYSPVLAGVFDDGSYVIQARPVFFMIENYAGIPADTTIYFRYGADGVMRDTLLRSPSREYFFLSTPTMGRIDAMPFGTTTVHAYGAGRLALGHTGRYQVGFVQHDARVHRIVRAAREPVPVTPADIQRYRDDQLSRPSREPQPQRAALLDRLPHGPLAPYFRDLRIDEDGNLWVEDFRHPLDREPVWTIYDADGRAVGRVATPPGLDIRWIGSDRIIGIWRDDFDVEHVRVYGIAK
jgi:hypothetical protein